MKFITLLISLILSNHLFADIPTTDTALIEKYEKCNKRYKEAKKLEKWCNHNTVGATYECSQYKEVFELFESIKNEEKHPYVFNKEMNKKTCNKMYPLLNENSKYCFILEDGIEFENCVDCALLLVFHPIED